MTDFAKESNELLTKFDKEELIIRLESMNSKLDRFEQLFNKVFSSNLVDAQNKPLTPAEARDYLKVGESTFARLVNDGQIAYSLSGKSKRFKVADLDAYLHRNSLSIGKGKGVKSLLSDANRKHQAV